MNYKKILLAMIVTCLLAGSVCAASVNDFNVGNDFKNVYSGQYYSVYTHGDDSGIIIYKNVNDDVYDDIDNDDILDGVIEHDGREYITHDDDMTINKTSDNTANFKDLEHGTHGISEVISANGEQFIVVSWAKDSSNMDIAKLAAVLNDFNKQNNVSPVAF